MRRAFAALMEEVDQLRRQLDDAKTRINYLEKLVDEDPLMPVVNRRAFVRELSRMMAYAQRYGAPSSIVYFDVNGLKRINDQHGHAAGDAVLVAVAQVLIENVRATDVVGRLGGDELGVLLVQTDQAQAWRKAGELAELIDRRTDRISGHGAQRQRCLWRLYVCAGRQRRERHRRRRPRHVRVEEEPSEERALRALRVRLTR